MATEETDQRANPNPTFPTTGPRAPWGPRLAFVAAILFLISWAFPVTAGLSKNTASFPKWWGMLDVGSAFVLAILALAILALAQGKVDRQAEDASYRAYRILTHGPATEDCILNQVMRAVLTLKHGETLENHNRVFGSLEGQITPLRSHLCSTYSTFHRGALLRLGSPASGSSLTQRLLV